MSALRYCESCGAESVPGARFCERCGAPMAAVVASTSTVAPLPPEPEPLPAASPAPVRPAVANANAARLGLIALVIAVVAIALVLWPRQSAVPPMSASSDAAVQTESAGRPSRALVTREHIEAMKAEVRAAHAAEVDSILSVGESSLQQRRAFDDALGLLGQGLYRHHVEDGNGNLEAAQTEMREFLENLDQSGLGLSEPVIDLGVASVAP